MAFTLPFPVRVAAGIVATGIQLVRSLPEELPAIPVALVGNAMRLSMKVQQEITTLATRGDELLGGLVGGRPQESPEWATFDEDKEPPRRAPTPAAGAGRPKPDGGASRSKPDGGAGRPKPDVGAGRPEPARSAPAEPARSAPAEPAAGPSSRPEPEASSLPDPDTTAMEAAAHVDDSVVELATHAAAGAATLDDDPAVPTEAGAAPAPAGRDVAGKDAKEDAGDKLVPPAAEETTVTDGPAVLPGYDGMTLAQVRGHLRELSAADVTTLLDYEQSGDNRAPFLTLLSNRLVTLGAQES